MTGDDLVHGALGVSFIDRVADDSSRSATLVAQAALCFSW
jgi:hypothetical protein